MARCRAGIDIELDHGWKTYWRMPGDAGVPPQFDWSGSAISNRWKCCGRRPRASSMRAARRSATRIAWSFRCASCLSRPADPVRLRLTAFFGVCKEVCIPVDGDGRTCIVARRSRCRGAASVLRAPVPAKADASSRLRVTRAFLTRDRHARADRRGNAAGRSRHLRRER